MTGTITTARILVREGWVTPKLVALCIGSFALLIIAVIGAMITASEIARFLLIAAACIGSGVIGLTGIETLNDIAKYRESRTPRQGNRPNGGRVEIDLGDL